MLATGSSLDQECVESAGQPTRSAAFVAASKAPSTYGAALEPRVVTDGSRACGQPKHDLGRPAESRQSQAVHPSRNCGTAGLGEPACACDRNLFWRSDGGQPFGHLAGGTARRIWPSRGAAVDYLPAWHVTRGQQRSGLHQCGGDGKDSGCNHSDPGGSSGQVNVLKVRRGQARGSDATFQALPRS